MVFVMVANVEGYSIEHAVIAEGFLLIVMREIMLLDPPGAQGVEADGEEEAGQEVDDGFGAEEIPDGGNEDGTGDPIKRNPFIKRLYLPETRDAEGLEKGVEQEPDDLADEVVIDQFGLPAIGQVGIEFVYSLEGVMFYMIAFERNRAGEQLGEVGENAGEPVGSAVFEQEVVGALMDHNKKGMIGESSKQIGRAEDDPPGAVPYEPGHNYLEGYEAKEGEEGVFVLSDKLSHFRMLLQDLFGTKAMRFLLSRINKISSF